MANSTGSRICGGSADKNPVTACTPIDYDDRRMPWTAQIDEVLIA